LFLLKLFLGNSFLEVHLLHNLLDDDDELLLCERALGVDLFLGELLVDVLLVDLPFLVEGLDQLLNSFLSLLGFDFLRLLGLFFFLLPKVGGSLKDGVLVVSNTLDLVHSLLSHFRSVFFRLLGPNDEVLVLRFLSISSQLVLKLKSLLVEGDLVDLCHSLDNRREELGVLLLVKELVLV
jgi:hypothetical protein